MPLAAGEPQHLVVMGVPASGKTTLATRLATRLGYEFADADDFHSPENIAKMARGEPLNDADREPWLREQAGWIAARHAAHRSTVLACSALKRRYRDVLRAGAAEHVRFIHLTAPSAALRTRMQQRKDHYMPAELIDSQLATLEPLQSDEAGSTLDATAPPDTLVEQVLDSMGTTAKSP